MTTIGKRIWAIAEGYIPPDDQTKPRAFVSHETACLLNTNDRDARVTIMIYFADRDPIGPFHVSVQAKRTLHVRFNDLTVPASIPHGTDYSSVIESDVPIVVQHTRLDSRNPNSALLTTIAYAE